MSKARKLALEALQRIDLWLKVRYQIGLVGDELEAIKALEEELKQEQGEPLPVREQIYKDAFEQGVHEGNCKAMNQCRLEYFNKIVSLSNKQEQGEPVAWLGFNDRGECREVFADDICKIMPTYSIEGMTPVYTTPQPRIWVGLTDDEVYEIYLSVQEKVNEHWDNGGTTMMFPITLYKAIEAKLKDKNI